MKDLLYKVNPVAKLIILVVLVIPVTMSKDIVFPSLILLFISVSGLLMTNIRLIEYIKAMRIIFISTFCLFLYLVFINKTSDTVDLYFMGVGLYSENVILATSLSLRMIGFAAGSYFFSKTTDPTDIAISLIFYAKAPKQAAYAFLVAYKFIPTFSFEFQKIKIAHEIRGGGGGANPFKKIMNIPKYLLPLLVQAIRVGQRVAISMDTKAFDITPEKTYYKQVNYGKLEYISIVITVCAVLVSLFLCIYFGYFRFGIGF